MTTTMTEHGTQRTTESRPLPKRRSNLRTALVVGSIAAVFFFGVIADHLIAKKLGLDKPADGRPASGARQ